MQLAAELSKRWGRHALALHPLTGWPSSLTAEHDRLATVLVSSRCQT